MVFLEEEGAILLADNKKIIVFAVSQSNLPPKAQILLGIEHLKGLQVSLDFALDHPFCQLAEAMACGQASLVSRVAVQKKSCHHLSDSVSFNDSLAVTSILLLLVGLCLSPCGETPSCPPVSGGVSVAEPFTCRVEGSSVFQVPSRLNVRTCARGPASGELSSLSRRAGLSSPNARARFCFCLFPSAFALPKRGVLYFRGRRRASLLAKKRFQSGSA
jgi:hypothetical protein